MSESDRYIGVATVPQPPEVTGERCEPDAAVGTVSRRSLLGLGVLVGTSLGLAGCGLLNRTTHETPAPTPGATADAAPSAPNTAVVPRTPEQEAILADLRKTGQSLIAMHEETPKGGWRFKSAIQAPHYQTDRDVGAASVGMGLLVIADALPNEPQWLEAAEKTADWLLEVSKTETKHGQKGRYWTDYVDDGDISSDIYTSFDDGVLGVGDYMWRLSEKSSKPAYREAALEALTWTFSQAKSDGHGGYFWEWDHAGGDTSVQDGMGEGAVGIIHTLATFYDRLKHSNPSMAGACKRYMEGGLRHLETVRRALGNNDGDSRALPETGVIGEDGDTNMNSGYLSGAAGSALMYLQLYKTFGDNNYLAKANRVFSWLEDEQNGPIVNLDDNTVAWRLALDPQGGDNDVYATGFEEGSAGIGWTYIQAYNMTGNKHYLNMAKKAANYLANVALPPDGGSWNEDENPSNPIVHANLNNGAAGIGMFLEDLAKACTSQSDKDAYHGMATKALNWIKATALQDAHGNIYWNDNDGEKDYSNDPSWHWGKAGIANFMARMSGGRYDIPGEQSALSRK